MTVLTEWEMCCPNCKRDDRLQVELTFWANLTTDGTDLNTEGDHHWDPGSDCRCKADGCGWHGIVNDATIAANQVSAQQEEAESNETA